MIEKSQHRSNKGKQWLAYLINSQLESTLAEKVLMDLGDKQLNLSQQSALAGMKLRAHLHWYRHSQQTRECHHFYFAMRLSLECCAWFGVPQFVKDLLD